MKFLNSIFVLLLVAASTFAQQRSLKEADEYFTAREYKKAVSIYKEVYKENKNASVLYKLAESNRLAKNFLDAEKYYDELISTHKDFSNEAYLNLGVVRMNNGKYTEALTMLNRYKEFFPQDAKVESLIKSCNWAKESKPQKSSFTAMLTNIPLDGLCFGMGYYKDELVYSNPVKEQEESDATARKYELLKKNLKDLNAESTLFSKTIENKLFIGSPTFSSDYNTMYFTKNASDKTSSYKGAWGKNGISSKGVNCLNIYYSRVSANADWSEPKPMEFNSDEYSCMHPTLISNGTKMYFSSNMPGGYGGYDLYVSELQLGKWMKPANLGSNINTEKDEMFPFVFNDTALYFSSNGLVGLGGADVFKVRMSDIGTQAPENMGVGINSVRDDFAFILQPDGLNGHMASNRFNDDNKDVILAVASVVKFQKITSTIVDDSTGVLISGAKISVYKGDSLIAFETSDKEGKINLKLNDKYKYKVVAKAFGYDKSETIYDPSTQKGSEIQLKLPLKRSYIEGQLLDDLTRKPIEGANIQVEVYDENGKLVANVVTDKEGRYRFPGDKDQKYRLKIKKEGYEDIEVVYDKENNGILNLKMVPKAEKNAVFGFDDILFEYGKSNLLEPSKEILDRVADYMQKKPNIKIELSAHTDIRGSASYNITLSDKRAKSCVDYLISKGTPSSNMISKGYGATKPKIDCGRKCTEQEHSVNRRVEIKILEVN